MGILEREVTHLFKRLPTEYDKSRVPSKRGMSYRSNAEIDRARSNGSRICVFVCKEIKCPRSSIDKTRYPNQVKCGA